MNRDREPTEPHRRHCIYGLRRDMADQLRDGRDAAYPRRTGPGRAADHCVDAVRGVLVGAVEPQEGHGV